MTRPSPMSIRRRTVLFRITAVAAAAVTLLVLAGLPPAGSAATPSLGTLGSQLGRVRARQQSLAESVASLGQLIAGLDGQIALVQSREATMRSRARRRRGSPGPGEAAADRGA